jgi:hypothetical protein
MTFRIGLLFHSDPHQGAVGKVAELLFKLEEKSKPIREGKPLTLVPFVRTKVMAKFTQLLADAEWDVEAATFDSGGVNFGRMVAIAEMQHPEFNQYLDFDLGMKVLIAYCDVILILYDEDSQGSEIRNQLAEYDNSSMFQAMIPADTDQFEFGEDRHTNGVTAKAKTNDGWLDLPNFLLRNH